VRVTLADLRHGQRAYPRERRSRRVETFRRPPEEIASANSVWRSCNSSGGSKLFAQDCRLLSCEIKCEAAP